MLILTIFVLGLPLGAVGAQVQYYYDPSGRLHRVLRDDNAGAIYEYDRAGNILSIDTLKVSSNPPEIYSISPSVLFKGTELDVVITGKNFFSLEEVYTDNPDIHIYFYRYTDKKIVIRIGITSEAAVGEFKFYVKTSYGEASVRCQVVSLVFSPDKLFLSPDEIAHVKVSIQPSLNSNFNLSIFNPEPPVVEVPSNVMVPAGGSGTFQVRALSEGTVVLKINKVGYSVWVTGPLEGDVYLSGGPVSVTMPLLVRNNTKILSSQVSVGFAGLLGYLNSRPVSVQLMDFLNNPRTYFDKVSVQMPFEVLSISEPVNALIEHRFSIKGTPFWAEGGIIEVDNNWQRIDLENTYTHPVVIAKPLSKKGADPAVVRIRNVTSTGFEIRVQEWDYLDGTHVMENVSYLVMEAGHYILDNGLHVEAGTISTDKANPEISFESVSFISEFPDIPIVITSVMTENDTAAVVTRNSNITVAGFEVVMQEEESADAVHGVETIGYIAWEPGSGVLNDIEYEVANAGEVTDAWATIIYGPFKRRPIFLMDMQTSNGLNTANLRYQNKTPNSIEAQVCEEQSADSELYHIGETVGYFAFY